MGQKGGEGNAAGEGQDAGKGNTEGCSYPGQEMGVFKVSLRDGTSTRSPYPPFRPSPVIGYVMEVSRQN